MAYLSDGVVRHLKKAAHWPMFADARYTPIAEIGRGGMGTVYLARDETLGREVAIKVATAPLDDTADGLLDNEARVLARLEHPGIVPVHDAGRLADGRPFYVMKHVRGQTLAEYLQSGPDLGSRLRVFERLCEAVAFAHAQDCLHRDLKPQNVMIGHFGEVLLLDWGIATRVGAPEGTDGAAGAVVLGTRGFMPPEVAGGRPALDVRTDVYGLGAVLFTLLTETLPPTEPREALSRVLSRQEGVPRRLRAICARALAPAREDRYATVSDLADDLARFRTGLAVSAYREGLLERLWRVAAFYRTPILILLAYLVMRLIVALMIGR